MHNVEEVLSSDCLCFALRLGNLGFHDMIPNFSCFGDGDLISEDDHSVEDTFKDDDRSKNLIVEPCIIMYNPQ